MDVENPSGRTAVAAPLQQRQHSIWPLKAVVYRRDYLDATTSEPIFHFHSVVASGGVLRDVISLSPSASQILFDAVCRPPVANIRWWAAERGITVIREDHEVKK
jgi:hypothetical protein